jgi:hypothetical protein
MEALGILGELGPFAHGGVAGVKGLFFFGGRNGLAHGNIQIPVK